jgi:putative transposase
MRELAGQYPRYDYRRIRIFLKRAGHAVSTDRTHRLWRQAALQVPRRRPRRRVATGRPRPFPPSGANQVWAYDFVFDTDRSSSRARSCGGCTRPASRRR